jgi:hypothetical protein
MYAVGQGDDGRGLDCTNDERMLLRVEHPQRYGRLELSRQFVGSDNLRRHPQFGRILADIILSDPDGQRGSGLDLDPGLGELGYL